MNINEETGASDCIGRHQGRKATILTRVTILILYNDLPATSTARSGIGLPSSNNQAAVAPS